MADLIDRAAVLAEIDRFQIRFNETGDSHERVAYASAEHCMLVIKEAPAVNRWIPCSERLPEFEREVLVYVKGNFDNSIPFITTAYINSDCDWQSDYDGEVIDSKITHWMPLPEPPEKE